MPKSKRTSKSSQSAKAPIKAPSSSTKLSPQPRKTKPSTKTAKCLALLSRSDGASIADLQTATDWQSHSVRGFLAATVKKKLGLTLTSTMSKSGERRYHIIDAGG